MLIESTKTTFEPYNSTERINNCNVKLNKQCRGGSRISS
jgi:hypothetical protein